jgi:nucleoside phosphorylase
LDHGSVVLAPYFRPIVSDTNKPHKTAVIITALGVETRAVLRHVIDRTNDTVSGTVFFRGRFEGWDIAVAEAGAGNPSAAAIATRALERYKPDVALFVGIAGGVKDVAIGDVVFGTKVYGYESGKDTAAGFKTRPDIMRAAHELEQQVRALRQDDDWKKRLDPTIKQDGAKVFVDPIAAGEKVAASKRAATARFLKEHYGDALAVEMEGRGFLEAVHISHPVQGGVIRGISDLLSGKAVSDKAGSQQKAADAASAVAYELLARLGRSGGVGTVSVTANDLRGYLDYELERTLPYSRVVTRRLSLLGSAGADKIPSDHLLESFPDGAVIVASSGYGKTTLANFLARQRAEQAQATDSNILPFYIDLPDAAATKRTVLDYAQERLYAHSQQLSMPAFSYLLRAAGGVLLLDGFDRLAPSVRPTYSAELKALRRDYHGLQIFVFSRTSSRPDVGLPLLELKEYSDEEQVAHAQITAARRGDPSQGAIGFMPQALRTLCKIPLLLQLALAYWYGHQVFPPDLKVLFRSWIDQLLDTPAAIPSQLIPLFPRSASSRQLHPLIAWPSPRVRGTPALLNRRTLSHRRLMRVSAE